MTGKHLSPDMQDVIVRMTLVLPVEEIVNYTGVAKHTVQQIIKYHHKFGTVALVPSKLVGRPPMLNEEDKAVLYSVIQRAPDQYLDELVDELQKLQNIKITEVMLSHYLARMNIIMKQIPKAALEQSKEKHAEFKYHMGLLYTPEQLVFVDESAGLFKEHA
ncbi:hypothetical protein DACRYDRAFT_109526 [Dacryopinax primogenitus]|uniref:Uncharacterized protein n=1 Tax=Dacryopinax primogenitus (strain DJM 731) TaxID=1858805 RepID=M5FS27_DACPD|nr:uncharacterized protein DACRYDRAFT_109526 [Dacryopinax primogenitus]EJU00106.1 hypothetical protein DACRYDRAFT_109526 [Dacryopinax primogenitus]